MHEYIFAEDRKFGLCSRLSVSFDHSNPVGLYKGVYSDIMLLILIPNPNCHLRKIGYVRSIYKIKDA